MYLNSKNDIGELKMTAKIFVLMVIACSGLSKAIPDNRSFPDPVFSRIDKVESIVIGNPANNSSTNCRLHIDYRNYVAASLKEVLQLAHRGKSAIRLNVWIESFNNKTKLTYVLPRLTWANEIGRTLISLIAAAENVPSMLLSSYTSTLNAGLVTLDIVVAEMTEGCVLLPGKNASDFVFSFLLHQLYPHDRVNDDHFDYKLCLWNKKTAYYTCCRLLGRVIICSDFSSITVLDYLTGVFVVALIAFILIVFPQMIMYISSFPKERTTYKISDSPMSLSSIFQQYLLMAMAQ
ncbi:uncharacterized protein LOC114537887 [Dendronephthya gigantea]|uniref:uncharacterized protein LOC114537887 n=1 Tax=Dendronephthya gigantea TaxID=151771 RepID=UPI00106DA7AF|nr:uncharacterized protein LOC114537887 [Dendronephthya gigantea]